MKKLPRLLLASSSLLLGAMFVLPIWYIGLEAPQYPEGISLYIKLRSIVGGGEFDLGKVNMLNHYIGMKAIDAASIPELKLMPWIVGALMLTGLLAAWSGKYKALIAWVVAFSAAAIAGLIDFYRWGYDYGHNLAPDAIIKIPGMTYQPPLIGTKQLLNFTAHSWPAPGGIAAGIALGLAVLAVVLARPGRRSIARHAFVPLLYLMATALPVAAQSPVPDTVVVSTHGTIRSVTAALSTVRRGGTVIVMPGVYREPMIAVVNPVKIVGRPGAILDGGNSHQIMSVGADSVSIRGLTFRNVGSSYTEDRAAIKVSGAQHCDIRGNTIEKGFFGIYLAKVSDCAIVGNKLSAENSGETSSGNGIHLWSSREILISDNSVSGFRDGIYFEFVHASDIRRNKSTNNLRYGLHFMYSDSCRYTANEFRRNLAGVAVMYTKTVTMESNTFADNWGSASYGLLLKEISDAKLYANTFSGNTVGIVADGAVRIDARGNDFRNNGWAIRLMASTYDGHFTSNNFTGNTFDVGADSEDNSNEFAGNYFDSYRGFDRNRDRTGDLPHYPVRLVSLISARYPMTMILMRSLVLDVLDMAERVLPSLIPTAVVDRRPAMRPVKRS